MIFGMRVKFEVDTMDNEEKITTHQIKFNQQDFSKVVGRIKNFYDDILNRQDEPKQ